MGKCKHIKKNNKICGAYALKDGEGFCLYHDQRPEMQEIRKKAADLAGKSQKVFFPDVIDDKKLLPIQSFKITKTKDVKKTIIRTIREIRLGQLDIETGRTILYGFNVLVNAIKSLDEIKTEKSDSNVIESDELKEIKEDLNKGLD